MLLFHKASPWRTLHGSITAAKQKTAKFNGVCRRRKINGVVTGGRRFRLEFFFDPTDVR